MKAMTLDTVVAAVHGQLIRGTGEHSVARVSHDSRKAGEGDLFFAIIGDRFDGHDFISRAAENGCRSFIISHTRWIQEGEAEGLDLILVEDTRKALQELAAWSVRDMGLLTIGFTGSTGKTSTKDMMYYVCSQKYKTGRTLGNFNNDIGMPLTVLSFPEDTEAAVLEMGMDHFGEIDTLARIARPRIALITNIGISHMENLGSREGIMKAKMEITNYFDENSTLIISTGKDLLRRENIRGSYRLVTTGTEETDDYVIAGVRDAEDGGISFTMHHGGDEQAFHLPVPGRHNALNAALAVAAGELLGIPMRQAADALRHMTLTGGRLTMKKNKDLLIIDDTYNASPDSMHSAVDVLSSVKGKRHIAIFGDMYELGKDSPSWHREVGAYAASKDVEAVYAIGDEARYIALGAGEKGSYFASKQAFCEDLRRRIGRNAAVLVKGSRGMAMEEIVAALVDMERE